MKSYYMKKARHRCSVPGCGNMDTFMLSRSRNYTGCVFLCGECIAHAAGETAAEPEVKKSGSGRSTEKSK